MSETESKDIPKVVKKSILDPTTYYRQKIYDVIYMLTGNKREGDVNSDIIILYVEVRLKEYLNSIRDGILRRKNDQATPDPNKPKRGRKKVAKIIKKEINKFNLKDLYEELDDTLEYYGVQRCIILKTVSRKLEKKDIVEDLPDDVVVEDDDVEETVIQEEDTIDELQTQLNNLDDKSRLYKKFEKERYLVMAAADNLTQMMSLEEYEKDYRNVKSKFIQKKDLFDKWIGWNKMGDNLYIAFSWLCVNRIKEILRHALDKRKIEQSGYLFLPDRITYDRKVLLDHKYVTERYLQTPSFIQVQAKNDMDFFVNMDEKFKHQDDYTNVKRTQFALFNRLNQYQASEINM